MNKRNFNSVCSMYRQGISIGVCLNLIIDFCEKKNSNPSIWIEKLYQMEIVQPLKDALILKTDQLEATKMALEREEVMVAELNRQKKGGKKE